MKKQERLKSLILVPSFALLVLIFGTSCGGYSYGTSKSNYYGDTSGTSTSGGTQSGATAGVGLVTGGQAANYSFRVGAFGYTGQTITVRAGKVLKVRFTPGQQDQKNPSTGYSYPYSKLFVYITVGSSQQSTAILDNGLYTQTVTNSGIMDYSSATSCSVNGSADTCRSNVNILVDHPNSDLLCIAGYMAYCPMNQQTGNMPWHGTLEVQTDDTIALQ